MRKKLTKTIIMMLLFTCLMAALAGCKNSEDSNLSHKEKFIDQLKQDANFDSATIEFTAAPFAQQVSLSWVYSIDFKIENGNIYLNDILYDTVEIIKNPEISYNTNHLCGADTVADEEISEALEKIKNSESCYLLKTQNSDAASREIAVYKIDDVYYFLSFVEDYELLRIHCSKMK